MCRRVLVVRTESRLNMAGHKERMTSFCITKQRLPHYFLEAL